MGLSMRKSVELAVLLMSVLLLLKIFMLPMQVFIYKYRYLFPY